MNLSEVVNKRRYAWKALQSFPYSFTCAHSLYKLTTFLFFVTFSAQAQVRVSEIGLSLTPQIAQKYDIRGPSLNSVRIRTFAYRIGADFTFKYRYSKLGFTTGIYYNNDLFEGRFRDSLTTFSPPSKEIIEGNFRQYYSFIEVPFGVTINAKIKRAIFKVNAGILTGWSLKSYETLLLNKGPATRSIYSNGTTDINNLRFYVGLGIGVPIGEKIYILVQPNIMVDLSDGLKNPIYVLPSHYKNDLFINTRFSIVKLL